jgi:hypothetical protein
LIGPIPRLRVFLDLDDCLISAIGIPEPPHGPYSRRQDVVLDEWKSINHDTIVVSLEERKWVVVLRPGLSHFLNEAKTIADLYIFTAGTKPYADMIVSQVIDPTSTIIKKAFASNMVTECYGGETKDLRKLGEYFDPKRSVLIDNRSRNMVLQPSNGIVSVVSTAMMLVDPKNQSFIDEENPLSEVLADLQNMALLDDVRPYLETKYQLFETRFKEGCEEHDDYLKAVKATSLKYLDL